MVEEQNKDGVVKDIKEQLESGKAGGTLKNRHLILGGLLYYLSDPDDDPTARLYIPKQLQDEAIRQYHDVDIWASIRPSSPSKRSTIFQISTKG